MSIEAVKKISELYIGDPVKKLVLLGLALNTTEDGVCVSHDLAYEMAEMPYLDTLIMIGDMAAEGFCAYGDDSVIRYLDFNRLEEVYGGHFWPRRIQDRCKSLPVSAYRLMQSLANRVQHRQGTVIASPDTVKEIAAEMKTSEKEILDFLFALEKIGLIRRHEKEGVTLIHLYV